MFLVRTTIYAYNHGHLLLLPTICFRTQRVRAFVIPHDLFPISFSLNTFRYKGLLNCAGEHRGELCWESAGFRAERPRPALLLLLLLFRGAPTAGGILAESPPGRRSPDSLPRETILGSIKSGFLCRNGPPKKSSPASKINSRNISLG